jgi:GTP cyclohydrolase II
VIDVRTYSGVIGILKYFKVPATMHINLATNNPKKAGIFGENGYVVGDFTPVVIEPTEHTGLHLEAKQTHLGHIKLVPKKGAGKKPKKRSKKNAKRS